MLVKCTWFVLFVLTAQLLGRCLCLAVTFSAYYLRHQNSTNHLKQLKDADERHFKELQQAKTAHQSDVAIANKERRQEVHQKRTGFCCVANFLQKHAPN